MIYRYTPNFDVDKNPNKLDTMVNLYHKPHLSQNQCSSIIVQTVNAPLDVVWSTVRKFDQPQIYKQFVKNCTVSESGTLRTVEVISGLPAERSFERLDLLDDELHLMVFSIVGGDHKLVNYRSTLTVHEDDDSPDRTVVVESYVVDVPVGSTAEDTCFFANTIIGCNLKYLAKISEVNNKSYN